jgi:protein-L-isoaspartate(D-aspartate) O-methyltransferase
MTIHPRYLAAFAGVLGACLVFPALSALSADDFERQRFDLMREIRKDVYATGLETGRRTLDPRVMEVMGQVPRHAFVPESVQDSAYRNRPLPIGYGQTISQPYIVALMTDMLEPEEGDQVLEIGTGSGYQAAVLAGLVKRVYTIEIIEPLGRQAGPRLQQLGYDNVETRLGDGYYGWPEQAPFDAIIVTAAASHIPPPLVEQLKPGGVMVIPVGASFMVQRLTLVKKSDDGKVTTRAILPVRFVPLTGEH